MKKTVGILILVIGLSLITGCGTVKKLTEDTQNTTTTATKKLVIIETCLYGIPAGTITYNDYVMPTKEPPSDAVSTLTVAATPKIMTYDIAEGKTIELTYTAGGYAQMQYGLDTEEMSTVYSYSFTRTITMDQAQTLNITVQYGPM